MKLRTLETSLNVANKEIPCSGWLLQIRRPGNLQYCTEAVSASWPHFRELPLGQHYCTCSCPNGLTSRRRCRLAAAGSSGSSSTVCSQPRPWMVSITRAGWWVG
jgi:hypothetical protein